MPKNVYWNLAKELQLYTGLTHSIHVLLEEQVDIFLHFAKLWEQYMIHEYTSNISLILP
jgi:hypothetical protein